MCQGLFYNKVAGQNNSEGCFCQVSLNVSEEILQFDVNYKHKALLLALGKFIKIETNQFT